MNADTITRALDTAIRLPGALQLQLVAENRATLFGREDRELPGLQDLGLRIPTEQQLLTLFESMNEAASLLEGCSSCFVAGTAVEVEDLRGYLTKAARICQEAPAAAFFVGDTDKERRDRWYSISTTFTKWARAVEGCRPSELAATQPASGQETGQIAASTPTAATALADTQTPASSAPGPTPVERFAQALNTHADELREGRFIKGKPGAWKWIRRRGRDISKGSLCDLLKLLDIREWSDWRRCAQAVGVTLNEHQRKRYASTQSKDHGELRRILGR